MTAHHVSDLDHHLRAVRAANAELRQRIDEVRCALAEARRHQAKRLDVERAIGARLLAQEIEIGRARLEADAQVAAIEAAAAEEVEAIRARGRQEAEQLREALEVVVRSTDAAPVLPLTRRAIADTAADTSGPADERSVAM